MVVAEAGVEGFVLVGLQADVLAGDAAHQLLDHRITMPGRSGLDVLKEIKQTRPKLPVLVLSIHPEDQYGKRALMAGASGYMNKESASEDLVRAIRQVLAGHLYVSSAMAESLAARLKTDSGRPPHEVLSDREFEILLLVEGERANV